MTVDLYPPPPMNEAQFQRQVVGVATWNGWGARYRKGSDGDPLEGLQFHNTIAYRSEPGWPDWVFIRRRDRRLIFAELKKQTGKLTPRQAQVLDLLSLFATDEPSSCGEWPQGLHKGEDGPGNQRRHSCCPPWIQVFCWRPSDIVEIEEILR